MTVPNESSIETAAGSFRALTWAGRSSGETVLFLHGLTAVAEVWGPTIRHLAPGRTYVAIDQRGHGDSPHEGPFHVGEFVRDTRRVITALGGPVHLVGHSMGARVAILLAARHPGLLRSVAIVDIGVEASEANIRETATGIGAMPRTFANEAEALAFAFRRRAPDADGSAVFLARLKRDGKHLTWRGSPEAMIETVRKHRSRAYWDEWRRIDIPSLYVRGARSNEVSPEVYERMRSANPNVKFVEFNDVPHNVPLVAPERLAHELETFWPTTSIAGGSL